MTREIKFRAWSKRMGLMIPNETMVEAGRQLVMFIKNARPNLPDHENAKGGLLLPTDDSDLIFMQYTGLKDRDGVEMYEGDLYKIEGNWPIYQVIFDEKTASFGLRSKSGPFYSFGKLQERNEIISEKLGNIYSTPQFLK